MRVVRENGRFLDRFAWEKAFKGPLKKGLITAKNGNSYGKLLHDFNDFLNTSASKFSFFGKKSPFLTKIPNKPA